MSKKLVSTIEGWEGTVTIADPLLLPQSLAVRKAIIEEAKFFNKNKKGVFEMKKGVIIEELLLVKLPSIFLCIEEWNIEGRTQPTAETFPFAGTDENMIYAVKFVDFLRGEILALYKQDEQDDPNH